MKSKTILIWSLSILAILVIVSPALSFAGILKGTALLDVATPTYLRADHAGSGIPVRLKIQRIHVDAIVEGKGLTPQGAMAVPEGPSTVGWYALGPRPGEEGSAVIAGHEGWKASQQAVFDKLYTLRKGDIVSVEDDRGTLTSFVVRDTQTYTEDGDTRTIFGSTDGKAHLNLITCEGTWDPLKKTYANRLVVFTDKE